MGLGVGACVRPITASRLMTKTDQKFLACPCSPGLLYAQCCAPYHLGKRAITAEVLMRSRYSAFALRLKDYLLKTWHPSTRPSSLDLSDGAKWLGLKVTNSSKQDPSHATVEFIARYRVGGGAAVRMTEISRFVLENSTWLYVDAMPAEASE